MQHLIKWNVLIQPLAGGILFSIYTFQTEPDKMAPTFSPRCGMLIVGSWTVCLFCIYFPNMPLSVMCQMGVLENTSSVLNFGALESWQFSGYHKNSPGLVRKAQEAT